MTREEVERAVRIVQSTGLHVSVRSPRCLLAWREVGGKKFGYRYIDVEGLLADPNPKAYACRCWTWGGAV